MKTDSQHYRYGFGGMEADNEVKSEGNSYDFGSRMYDPRVGRFLSRDRYEKEFQSDSPYSYVSNSPLIFIDYNGDFKIVISAEAAEKYGLTKDKITRFTDIVNNLGEYLVANPNVLAEIAKQTGWSEEQVLAQTVPGAGPTISLDDNTDNFFSAQVTEQSWKDGKISMDAQEVKNLEGMKFIDSDDESTFNLIYGGVVLHELTHYGDREKNGGDLTGEFSGDNGAQNAPCSEGHRGLSIQRLMFGRTTVENLPKDTNELPVDMTKPETFGKKDPNGWHFERDMNFRILKNKVKSGVVNSLPKDQK